MSDVADINSRSTNPRKELVDSEFSYIDIDSVEGGSGTIKTPKRILGKNAPSRARRIVLENDIIMSTVRPYLKAFALISKEYDRQICSTGFAVLTCKKEIMPYYLLSTLFSDIVISQCNRMMVGGQYPALNNSQVSNILIPLPPLLEQQGISKILTVVDLAIQKTQKIIVKTEYLKKGLMQEFLIKGIDHKEFKDTEIGKIPKAWEIMRLEEACKETTIGVVNPATPYYTNAEDGVPYFRSQNVRENRLEPTQTYVMKEFNERHSKSILRENDLLTVQTGFIGMSCLVPKTYEGSNCHSLLITRTNPKLLNPQFLCHLLNSEFGKNIIMKHNSGWGRAHLLLRDFRKIKIPIPPLHEQEKIADAISATYKKLRVEGQEKAKLDRIKVGLMDLLLTGKIRLK